MRSDTESPRFTVRTLIAAMFVALGPILAARAAEPAQPLELFTALADGSVQVRFVPANAEHAALYLVNTTADELQVRIPPSFAGAPVLPKGVKVGVKETLGTEAPQILGSVVRTAQRDPRQPAKPVENLVTLAPQKVVTVPIVCVCLQYGNPTPRPSDPFTIMPVGEVTDDPHVQELLDQFALGNFDQPVAQLAAWHFSNGLTSQQLAATGFARARLAEAAQLVRFIQAETERNVGDQTEEAPKP